MEKERLFSEIGLTQYETKAYMALLKYDLTEVNTIYKETKIPFGKIYSVLESLMKKGFIELINIRPKRYRAIKPEIAFERYHKKEENWLTKKLNFLKENMADLLKEFSATKIQKKKEEIFWTTDCNKSEIEKLNNTIYYYPKKYINTIPHITNRKQASALFDKIEQHTKNNITFKIILLPKILLLFKKNEKFQQLVKLNKLQIKTIKKINSYFTIIDDTTVFFLNINPLDKNKLSSIIAIWNKDLTKDISKEFEKIWEKGFLFKL